MKTIVLVAGLLIGGAALASTAHAHDAQDLLRVDITNKTQSPATVKGRFLNVQVNGKSLGADCMPTSEDSYFAFDQSGISAAIAQGFIHLGTNTFTFSQFDKDNKTPFQVGTFQFTVTGDATSGYAVTPSQHNLAMQDTGGTCTLKVGSSHALDRLK